jgi:hypothetical protein
LRERNDANARATKAEAELAAERAAANQTITELHDRARKAECRLAAERIVTNATTEDLHDKLKRAERTLARVTKQGDEEWGKMLRERDAALARVAELDAECEFLATAENRAKAHAEKLDRSRYRYRRALHKCATVLRVYVRAQGVDTYQSQHDPERVGLAAFAQLRKEGNMRCKHCGELICDECWRKRSALFDELEILRKMYNELLYVVRATAGFADKLTSEEAHAQAIKSLRNERQRGDEVLRERNDANARATKAEADLAASRLLVARLRPVVDAARAMAFVAPEASHLVLARREAVLMAAVKELDEEKP